ncbi:MAG: AtpZ/AtpI family protein [Bacteroidales bacterium]|nr:AtpZ/AtpI family protein [Bacteroidales bacterium]
MKEPEKEKNQKNQENNWLKSYAKYSALALQMIVIIVVTTFSGVKLDELLKLHTPVFTIILSLLGVFGGIYFAIKDFIKKQ